MNLGFLAVLAKENPAQRRMKKGGMTQKKGFWRLIWGVRPVTDLQELTELILSLQNLFCINFNKTSY